MLVKNLILLVLLGCVSADKNEQTYQLHPRESNISEVFMGNTQNIETQNIKIQKQEFNPNSNLIHDVFHNFIVDNKESAYKFLSRNFIISYVVAENKTDKPIHLNEEQLTYKIDDKVLKPIHPSEFPKQIYCVNWKGNIKNLYNLSIFTGAVLIVAGAAVTCVKNENDCEQAKLATEYTLKLSQTGEVDPEKSFSNPIFTTNIKYTEILNEKTEAIPPLSKKKGILIYERPITSLNKARVLNSLNCVLD
ncbi:MAG: hypothetical protein SFU98_21250 [Leptospiraceae bacterium]|nr:hypothetical protein [Leptospiraceae bacterium]